MYDYCIVGAGLYGCVMADGLAKRGKTILLLDKREHVGGNVACEVKDGIVIHKYGAHIFHTDSKRVWDFVNEHCEMRQYCHSPIAYNDTQIYNLPFNMNTFYKLYGAHRPSRVKELIEEDRVAIENPKNLEEQALALAGRKIYYTLIKGYTEKQWGRACRELPTSIIKRIPLRMTFDNNYFNDRYQGLPERSYNELIGSLLNHENITIKTGVDFMDDKKRFEGISRYIIYTGSIDEYFDYCYGALEYRSLKFSTVRCTHTDNIQGVAVMNHTGDGISYTRTIEHRHFMKECNSPVTWTTTEYPAKWEVGKERYYPIGDEKNLALYAKYKALADKADKIEFGGRLGDYKYYDMDDVIAKALERLEMING